MTEKTAYTQAFQTGKYEKASGLLGKYDNVRRFWEDQVTGYSVRPALNNLVERKRHHLERIRVIDLGCGGGDGYDQLMGVTTKDPPGPYQASRRVPCQQSQNPVLHRRPLRGAAG